MNAANINEYVLNLHVWKDPILDTGKKKSGEGTKEAEGYTFQYSGDGFTHDGILKIPVVKFAEGPVKITFKLNQHVKGESPSNNYKFSWIHARRAEQEKKYRGRGQRFEMLSWNEHEVSFLLDKKIQYRSDDKWHTDDSAFLALDVWVQHCFVDLDTGKTVKAKINCDPEIEIRH
jgi:hypothetical protein